MPCVCDVLLVELALEAVLWREQNLELDLWRAMQEDRGADSLEVCSGVVGDQSDLATRQGTEIGGLQDVDAILDRFGGLAGETGGCAEAAEYEPTDNGVVSHLC